jgi:phosphate transport system protein
MKIGNDFARYGRYALDISIIKDQLNDLAQCDTLTQEYLNEMSAKVLSMVKISVDSLKKQDLALAKTISKPEHEVDKMYSEFLHKLVNKDQTTSKCVISNALMTRYLERIADHAIYICESIVYIVTGEKVNLD